MYPGYYLMNFPLMEVSRAAISSSLILHSDDDDDDDDIRFDCLEN